MDAGRNFFREYGVTNIVLPKPAFLENMSLNSSFLPSKFKMFSLASLAKVLDLEPQWAKSGGL